MTRPAAIWGGFTAIVAHNVEECVTIGGFLERCRDTLPGFLRAMTGAHFTLSLIAVTILAGAVYWLGARSEPGQPWLAVAVAFSILMGLNALQHAAVAVRGGGYAPGMVTGLALCLPYALYLATQALRNGWVAVQPLIVAVAVTTVVAVPVVMAMHALSMVVL